MKRLFFTVLAVFLISAGTNASNTAQTSQCIKAQNAEILKKLKMAYFTAYVFYQHYDPTSNETWMFVGNSQDGMDSNVITTAYYVDASGTHYAAYIGTYVMGEHYKDFYSWNNSPTNTSAHLTCTVHLDDSQTSNYFTVDEDMITNPD